MLACPFRLVAPVMPRVCAVNPSAIGASIDSRSGTSCSPPSSKTSARWSWAVIGEALQVVELLDGAGRASFYLERGFAAPEQPGVEGRKHLDGVDGEGRAIHGADGVTLAWN